MEHYDDPISEPSYVPSDSPSIEPSVFIRCNPSLKPILVTSLVIKSNPSTDRSNFHYAVKYHHDNPSYVSSYVPSVVTRTLPKESHSSVPLVQ